MSHTRDRMSNYKKASSETNVEVADGNILPVDGFGRIAVDLDQPRSTTMMVRVDDVAYLLGLSSRQWSNVENRLFTTRRRPFWGSPEMSQLLSSEVIVFTYMCKTDPFLDCCRR